MKISHTKKIKLARAFVVLFFLGFLLTSTAVFADLPCSYSPKGDYCSTEKNEVGCNKTKPWCSWSGSNCVTVEATVVSACANIKNQDECETTTNLYDADHTYVICKWNSAAAPAAPPTVPTPPTTPPAPAPGPTPAVPGTTAPTTPAKPAATAAPADTSIPNCGQACTDVTLDNPISSSNLAQITGGIIGKGLTVMGSIAFLVFIYGGFMWLTSAGNAEHVKSGTDAMIWAVIGLCIIFSSYAILNKVFESLGVQGASGTSSDVGATLTGTATTTTATTAADGSVQSCHQTVGIPDICDVFSGGDSEYCANNEACSYVGDKCIAKYDEKTCNTLSKANCSGACEWK